MIMLRNLRATDKIKVKSVLHADSVHISVRAITRFVRRVPACEFAFSRTRACVFERPRRECVTVQEARGDSRAEVEAHRHRASDPNPPLMRLCRAFPSSVPVAVGRTRVGLRRATVSASCAMRPRRNLDAMPSSFPGVFKGRRTCNLQTLGVRARTIMLLCVRVARARAHDVTRCLEGCFENCSCCYRN